MFDILGKLIRHRGFEAGAQGIVIVRRLFPGLPPFAAVIEAWDAWHPKQQAIGEWDMLIVGQYAGKPGYIMVIYESYQMLAPVNAPGIRAKLPVQGMGDLKKIHTVKTGINPLLTLIVCAAVKHPFIYDHIIVSK